jgi:Cu-processing system ATP-binding protein
MLDMMKDIRKHKNMVLDEELIQQFKLNELLDKRMRTLSGGTRQKVSAALAFLFNPEVLILDEPTAGLDPLAAEILKEKIIIEKKKGKLVLITSHILSELDELVTQVIYMQESKLIFHKSIEDLRADTGQEKLSKAIAGVMLKMQ